MGKIKGWKLREQDLFSTVYKSIKKRLLVIRFHNDKPISVVVDYEKEIKPFKTKKQAIDYAIKYMKAHPNG